ncbi:hypothetical protein ACFSLT_03995 [Novosphingobium resinovorum]
MAALETESEVIAVTGYAAVRQAFNDVLDLCVVKLTQADRRFAWEVLDLGGLDEDDTAAIEMLSDTALFSRRNPCARAALSTGSPASCRSSAIRSNPRSLRACLQPFSRSFA